MTKEDTMAKLAEQDETIEELRETLANRPEKIVVETNEVTVSNSEIGGERLGLLFEALAKCQKEFKAVKKGSEGHGYSYTDLADILAYSQPITAKNGISVVQMNVSKMMGKTPLVGVKTILGHSEGGYISGEVYMPTVKTKMNSLVQMAGVNMSYLRRYGIQSALGLATTDNDGSDK